MVKKAILLICDGLGDRPIKEFGNLTPLEAAKTPNIDKFAKAAETGVMYTLGRGVTPGSDVAHMALFGYNPYEYYRGRGPIEACGIGIKLEHGDVAFRGNLGTVNTDGLIIDRRAGRITDVKELCEAVDGIEINGIKFIVKAGTAHRAVVVMRGKGLSSNISSIDPKAENAKVKTCVPLDDTPEAKFTAETLNQFTEKSRTILSKHPFNQEREKNGDLVGNIILLRGAGQYEHLQTFYEKYGLKGACVAGGGLYKGIASMFGMDVVDVEGATALPNTNVRNKFSKAVELINGDYDFVFIHVKPTDSLAEDKKPNEKRAFVEKIDDAFAIFNQLNDDTLLVVTADHSTPCEMGRHSADSVPVMFWGSSVRPDNVESFGERACSQGGLGVIEGKDLMPQIQNLLGNIPLYGA